MDGMGKLRGQFMVRQRGDQADYALRNALCDGGEVRLAQRREFRQPIQSPGELLQFAGVPHGVQRSWMDSRSQSFAGAQRPTVLLEDVSSCLVC